LKAKISDGIGTATELANMLGISSKDVATLAASGVLARDKARGTYRLQASVKNYCEILRKAATGREGPSSIARRKLLRSQADYVETRAAIDADELVETSAVLERWSGIFRLIRSMAMAIPSRVAARIPTLTRRDTTEIDDVVREKLMTAANCDDIPSDQPDGDEK
jgi:phage terminase Nu1 subunit (DNA packaging protein)